MSHLILYFVGFLFALMILLWRKRSQFNVYRWQKSLHLEKHAQAFHQLYQGVNGFTLSQKAREEHDAMEYTYGEIQFLSFIALLSLINPNENTVFYDLGSGIGKAVVACGMVFPVRKSVGIELFPELYFAACKRIEQLKSMEDYAEKAKKMKFVLCDFLDANLNDATLIFINSTAFFGSSWEKLCSILDHLTHLDTVITTSKTLICTNFTLVTRTKVEMSWGIVFAYIHSRKPNPKKAVESTTSGYCTDFSRDFDDFLG